VDPCTTQGAAPAFGALIGLPIGMVAATIVDTSTLAYDRPAPRPSASATITSIAPVFISRGGGASIAGTF
jgi:hypothetical protein